MYYTYSNLKIKFNMTEYDTEDILSIIQKHNDSLLTAYYLPVADEGIYTSFQNKDEFIQYMKRNFWNFNTIKYTGDPSGNDDMIFFSNKELALKILNENH